VAATAAARWIEHGAAAMNRPAISPCTTASSRSR